MPQEGVLEITVASSSRVGNRRSKRQLFVEHRDRKKVVTVADSRCSPPPPPTNKNAPLSIRTHERAALADTPTARLEKEARTDDLMGSRGGGGLQGLLEHAAREYERVDTETRGPEVRPKEMPNRPAAAAPSPQFSWSSDPEEQSADRLASSRGNGSSPRGAGMPSRKRPRDASRPFGASLSPSQGLNSHFSEDGEGGSAGEGYGGDAEAAAEREGAGTNRFGVIRLFAGWDYDGVLSLLCITCFKSCSISSGKLEPCCRWGKSIDSNLVGGFDLMEPK